MSQLPILYNYKPFDVPRLGFFRVQKEPGEYVLPEGWLTLVKPILIIGETDEHYIDQLKESDCGYWIGDKVVKEYYILPLGPHKSRLEHWSGHQLSLF